VSQEFFCSADYPVLTALPRFAAPLKYGAVDHALLTMAFRSVFLC